jgi:hypothetical protein
MLKLYYLLVFLTHTAGGVDQRTIRVESEIECLMFREEFVALAKDRTDVADVVAHCVSVQINPLPQPHA